MSVQQSMVLGRRRVMQGAAGLLGGLPLAAVLADPRLARAAAGGLHDITIDVPGHGKAQASVALPIAETAPAVMLIHEWWGLNDQIKAVAAELAQPGYVACAIDLFQGKVATTPDAARAQTQAVDPAQARAVCRAWLEWLEAAEVEKRIRGNGVLATLGWCFGGGWSLQASMLHPVNGTVIYYGRVGGTPEELRALRGPVQGHFGTKDKFINETMVTAWSKSMDAADRSYEVFWYDADHAFANPTGSNYDAPDAKLAWDRTTSFLKQQTGLI
ncbi:MAG: dienelactone hydrolase family protein [Sneathiellaceae bacterium]